MTRLFLVRHGQTDWNLAGRWQGQADPPLNASGREQAARAAAELKARELDAIYCSDLARACETAEIIATRLGVKAVTADTRLREINLGAWQGLLSAEIQSRDPDEFTRWMRGGASARPPGGETLAEQRTRVLKAVNEIALRHQNGRVLIVSHKLPILFIRLEAAGLEVEHMQSQDLSPVNGVVIEVEWPPAERPLGHREGSPNASLLDQV